MISIGKILFFLSSLCCLVFGGQNAARQVVFSALKQYDILDPPNLDTGTPVNVGVTLFVLGFNSFSDKKMDLSLDMYFRQLWTDPRLSYSTHPELKADSVHVSYDSIWTPDTFFATAKDATIHSELHRNTFTRVNSSGSVIHSNRLTTVLNCPKNFRLFPLDTQICTLEFESFGYKASDIMYHWHKGMNSVGISPEVDDLRPEFKFLGFRQSTKIISLSTGNYSRLSVDFAIARNSASYILKIFFPSTLIVILSWLGFWISPTHKSARICLGIISTLILVDIFINETDHIPKTCYVKVVDIYLVTCLIMVALYLLESIVVFHSLDSEDNSKETEMIVQTAFEKKLFGVASKCDKYSRIAFPLTFFCFCLIYWITVVKMSSFHKDDDFVPIDE